MVDEYPCMTRMGEYQFFMNKGVDTPFTKLLKDKIISFEPFFLKRNDKSSLIYKDGHVYYVDFSSKHNMNQKGINTDSVEWIVQEAIETSNTVPCDLKIVYHHKKGIIFAYAKYNENTENKIVYHHLGAKYIKLYPVLDGPLTTDAVSSLDSMGIDPSNIKVPTELKDIVLSIAPEYHSILCNYFEEKGVSPVLNQEISFDFKYGRSSSTPSKEEHKNFLHSSSTPRWYALEINSNPSKIKDAVFIQYQSKMNKLFFSHIPHFFSFHK